MFVFASNGNLTFPTDKIKLASLSLYDFADLIEDLVAIVAELIVFELFVLELACYAD
jgi:hypothetical protein